MSESTATPGTAEPDTIESVTVPEGQMSTMVDTEARQTVIVLYGGQSPEHSVSCVSAGAIMDHLDPSKYTVVPVGIAPGGMWVPGETDTSKLRRNGRELPIVTAGEVELAISVNPERRGEIRYVTGPDAGEIYAVADVVFPVLHGPFGEDGTVQGLLELSGVPYVGPGVLASAAGMDKERTKNLLLAANLPIGEQVVLHPGKDLEPAAREFLGLPVFVKPARGGSSIGISKVDSWAQFDEALELARQHDWKVIVEKGLVGAEVEVGVLQLPDGSVTVSVPALLNDTESSDEGFYGFDTKYLDDVVTAQIPAQLPQETLDQLTEFAARTFRAIGADGLSRIDFFVTEEGPVLNEVNTMPGFTPISMYPQMFAASGIGYEDLVETVIARALTADR